KADNEVLRGALEKYHRERLTNNALIADRLFREYGITMRTLRRRRKELGFEYSGVTMQHIDPTVAEQIVIDEMSKDLSRTSGPRKFIEDVMHDYDNEGFELREPTAKRVFRVKKFPIGIHHRWSADGHDKLYKIGFPVWAIVEDASSRWLGAWVVPSNRTGNIIAYLYLCNIEKYGGMPIQITTDCGSETTKLFGIVNALRERFHPEIGAEEIPPHVYLRSIHNISVERSWLRLRLDVGDTIVLAFNKGIEDGIYNPSNPQQ
ncbi:hypothetical protein C0991_000860, partial [Blastosporella zonata]